MMNVSVMAVPRTTIRSLVHRLVHTTHRHQHSTSLHHHSLPLDCTSYRHKSSKVAEDEIDLDKPIKFSTSRAASWKPRDSYGTADIEEKMPWYQPYVVLASTSIFLLYFCVLREENDIDRNLRKTLYDHIEGLEEQQLEAALQYQSSMGQDTSAITARLTEIRVSQN